MSDRFACILKALCDHVATRLTGMLPSGERVSPLSLPVVLAISLRLDRLAGRFARLVALALAGKLPVPQVRAARPAPARDGAAAAAAPDAAAAEPVSELPPRVLLPSGFGWLVRLRVPFATVQAAELHALLMDPAMIALVSSHPAFGRVLRPLCHMLAILPDPALVLLPPPAPRTVRPRRARPKRPTSRRGGRCRIATGCRRGCGCRGRCARNWGEGARDWCVCFVAMPQRNSIDVSRSTDRFS